jgi:peptidoglycan/xylan/chitin deacetylase (PgdA/CDA1 family)
MFQLFKDISVIQFHNITKNEPTYRLWLPLQAFRAYFSYLMKNGYALIGIGEALEKLRGQGRPSKRRPISLTFDHGYASFYDHVYPLLKETGTPATVLISPGKVGKTVPFQDGTVAHLHAHQLREMADNEIAVGAYEDTAWNINEIDPGTVRRHIRQYKGRLEDITGREVKYFGVKEGVPSTKVRDLLIASGYEAFLTQCPTHRSPDPYAVGRIQVDDDDFNIFLTKISKTYLFFKDKRSWRYIREYKLDRVAHRLSETLDRLRGNRHGK